MFFWSAAAIPCPWEGIVMDKATTELMHKKKKGQLKQLPLFLS